MGRLAATGVMMMDERDGKKKSTARRRHFCFVEGREVTSPGVERSLRVVASTGAGGSQTLHPDFRLACTALW